MECQYCEHYRTATKRYVKQVGRDIVKFSRECRETRKIVTGTTKSCPSFTLTKYVWCISTHHWANVRGLCFFKPYKECKKCPVATELMTFLHIGGLKRIPLHTKRRYPKVKPPSPEEPKGGNGTGGNGKKVKSSKFTALDAALDASNANSYLSTSADEPEYELVSPTTPLDLLLQKERLESDLSKEAKSVVELILSNPEKVCSPVTGNITKGSLTNYLRNDGWMHKVIVESFRELRTVAMSF